MHPLKIGSPVLDISLDQSEPVRLIVTWQFGHHEGVWPADGRGEDESEEENNSLVHSWDGMVPTLTVLTQLIRPGRQT